MEDSAEEYLLKWNAHNAEVISEFHELCREEKFTDVTLAVEDVTFEAHRLVLSACSPYFRHLLTLTKSKHPVIFLKDMTADHVALLLKYMYLGEIAVKKEELPIILKSADQLRIRGLAMTGNTTSTALESNSDVIIQDQDEDHEAHRKIIAPPTTVTTVTKGRKGYLPKKIRTSGDRISDSSSPGTQSFSDSGLHCHAASPVHQRRSSGPTALPTIMETFNNNSKDNLVEPMDALEQEGAATTTEEENEEDQPVDFSQSANANGNQPRYSILSNYLKTGKLGHKQIRPNEAKLDDNEAASISKAAESLAASWLEQSLTAMQPEDPEDNAKKEKRDTVPLQETLGIDIADRLRSHFLSNLPAQSLNWLNNSSPNGKISDRGSSGNIRQQNVSGNGAGGQGIGANAANGKPAVTCEICGKKLADPSSLYRHRKIHSGDKPHKCPYCTRRFIQRYNMKQHIKTHRMEPMTDAEKAEYLPRPRQAQDVGVTN